MSPTKRLLVMGAALAVALSVAAACDMPTTNTSEVVSMIVDTAPAPSVVAGDTMRIGDSTALGVLQAQAFNIKGAKLQNVIQFIPLDPTLLSIDGQGHVFASTDSVPSNPRIVADAAGLQSAPFTIPVTFRPDSLQRDTTDTIQVNHGLCDTVLGPVSLAIIAHLLNKPDTGFVPIAVPSYLVHWTILSPASLAGKETGNIAIDSSLAAYISDPTGVPTVLDTTKSDGSSTRYLTFSGQAFKNYTTDTLVVIIQASARYQGRTLKVPVVDTLKFINPSKC